MPGVLRSKVISVKQPRMSPFARAVDDTGTEWETDLRIVCVCGRSIFNGKVNWTERMPLFTCPDEECGRQYRFIAKLEESHPLS